MSERRATTMELSGNDYAKVAERLKLFRTDFPHSKTETAYEYDVDKTVVFTVWIWKDKKDLLDLMKAGIIDKDALRSSSDANGTAKGEPKAKKDFEKLESIALGRALGMIGYLASGEIASFEEMDEFNAYRDDLKQKAIDDAVKSLKNAKTLEELKKAFIATHMMEVSEIVAAKDKRKSELSKTVPTDPPKPVAGMKTPAQKPATPLDTPVADPKLPLDEGAPSENN